MNIEQLYALYLRHPFVRTDTRALQEGDLFFALKGPRFNGNQFAAAAIEAGAAYAVIDDEKFAIPGKTILVDDSLQTLQSLAYHHRQTFSIPFLAITGSNGKTTTKELIHQVLSAHFTTYTTIGNLNNHIGIPLTLLSIRKDAQMAVIEMGANHIGEIAAYCRYTMPTHGIITNVGRAHLEGFGGINGVRKAKGELYDYLREHGGTAFIMWDYDYLREMSKGIMKQVRYGSSEGDITGLALQNGPYLEVHVTGGSGLETIRTRLVGEYNLANVLAAISVGKYFAVPEAAIRSALEAYSPTNSRSQMLEIGSNKIILDAYNANPSSMKSSIENFSHLQGDNKVLILGGMAELGHESLSEHQALLSLVERFPWKQVVLVGGDFLQIPHSYISFKGYQDAKKWYREQHFENTFILIKGSRSMQMEKILE